MTLRQIGAEYRSSAALLQARLRQLRSALKTTRDQEAQWQLRQRIAQLEPLLTQCNTLAQICEQYYERGYYRDERYI